VTTTTDDLLGRFDHLPARSVAAMRVLGLVDAPGADAADLAEVIATDPKFTARVIGLANSSYYGLARQVGSLTLAVSIIGFRAIRSLAIAAVSGLGDARDTPTGFWDQASLTATACDLLAPQVDADPGDAFTAGLLHTFGTALLHQLRPGPGPCLPPPTDPVAHARTELDLYGIGHADAAAIVLDAWNLPTHITQVIAGHHRPVVETSPPLTRALAGARILTTLALTTPTPQQLGAAQTDLTRVTQGRYDAIGLPSTLDLLTARASALQDALQLG
jgi:HD-like signal output (HDOD) protein